MRASDQFARTTAIDAAQFRASGECGGAWGVRGPLTNGLAPDPASTSQQTAKLAQMTSAVACLLLLRIIKIAKNPQIWRG